MEANVRKERINQLLDQLKYEITRGIMEREIEESLGFAFIIPISNAIPKGVVWCEFRTLPMLHPPFIGRPPDKGLYVVK